MTVIPWSNKSEKTIMDNTDELMLFVPSEPLSINKNKRITKINAEASLQTRLVYAASDEDSPLSVGLLYTTEASSINRTINNIQLSLKNAPTGTSVTVDMQKETGINTNSFATIFSTLPTVDITEFTSQTAAIPPVLSDNAWEMGKRLQIILTINDTNFAATGLKVTLT